MKKTKRKHEILLINDERKLLSVKKAVACDGTAYDGGCEYQDLAHCANYAYDKKCSYDLAACTNGADDYCGGEWDTRPCATPGELDIQ